MAVNPTVVQGVDPVQAFLEAQKRNQDLVKSVLETMRLQQEVDDRKRQNQWDNTWNVISEASKNYAGGMAGFIGQNQDLVKQLFRSNGMTSNQANLAVTNLKNTLLGPAAQAELRLSKYMMDPYAVVNEVVEPPAEAPKAETPVAAKTEAKAEPSAAAAAPQEPAAEPATGIDPIWRRAERMVDEEVARKTPAPYAMWPDDYTTANPAVSLGVKENVRNKVLGHAFATLYQEETKDGQAPSPSTQRFIDTITGTFKGANMEQTLQGAAPNDAMWRAANALDTMYYAFSDDVAGGPHNAKALEQAMSLLKANPSEFVATAQALIDQGLINPTSQAAKKMYDMMKAAKIEAPKLLDILANWDSYSKSIGLGAATPTEAPAAVKPTGEYADVVAYVMRNPGAAASIMKAWPQKDGESEADYHKRIEEKVRKANPAQAKTYDQNLASANAAAVSPSTTTTGVTNAKDIADAGVVMAGDQAVRLAALNADTPQGQKAIQLINNEGTKVIMTFDKILANQANNTPIDGKTKSDYINYLDKMSDSASDWLSSFAPLTDDYLKSVTGRTDVKTAYEDFMALATGGGAGLLEKKSQELQAQSLKDAMTQFTATFGLDKEKFDWQKNLDIAQIYLTQKELEIRSAQSGSVESEFLKRQLDVIDKYDKMNTGKTPEERMNQMIKFYSQGGEFRTAWDTYVLWTASSMGISPNQLTEATFQRGWFGTLVYSIFGGKKLTMPIIPGMLGGSEAGNEGSAEGSDAAKAYAQKRGF